MRCVATTIIRHTPFGRPVSGRIFYVDFAKGVILKEKSVPPPLYPLSDDNPRGGVRGGRGVGIRDGKIYIANYDSIFVYNKKLKLLERITHPLFAGLHEIEVVKDGIWAASTWIDLLLKVDFKGNILFYWYYREDRDFLKKVGRDMVPVIDFQNDYRRYLKGGVTLLKRAHINCVRFYKRNKAVVTFGQCTYSNNENKEKLRTNQASWGYVVILDTKQKFSYPLYKRKLNFPMHNGEILPDKFLVLNNSHRMENLLIDIKTKKIKKKIKVPGTWLRGLAVWSRRQIIVGSAPASIYEINLEKGRITNFMNLSRNPNEAIHGLCIVKR